MSNSKREPQRASRTPPGGKGASSQLRAYLVNANLESTVLRGARLEGAALEGAKLLGAGLSGAAGLRTPQLP
jgi:uncharacterized protein YjbI with pentapeptide repeats